MKNEKGSITLLVLVTVFFLAVLLSTSLVYVVSKRKSQLEETKILQEVYYGNGMQEAYHERYQKK